MSEMSFGEWANNARTKSLMGVHEHVVKNLRAAREESANRQDKINALTDTVADLQGQLNAMRDEVERRCVNIDELENTVRQADQFIGLLASRLKNAREHIMRVRRACDVFQPAGDGPGLDP